MTRRSRLAIGTPIAASCEQPDRQAASPCQCLYCENQRQREAPSNDGRQGMPTWARLLIGSALILAIGLFAMVEPQGTANACPSGTCAGNPAPLYVEHIPGYAGKYRAFVYGPDGLSVDFYLNGVFTSHNGSGVSPYQGNFAPAPGLRVFAAIANYTDGTHRYYETAMVIP